MWEGLFGSIFGSPKPDDPEYLIAQRYMLSQGCYICSIGALLWQVESSLMFLFPGDEALSHVPYVCACVHARFVIWLCPSNTLKGCVNITYRVPEL